MMQYLSILERSLGLMWRMDPARGGQEWRWEDRDRGLRNRESRGLGLVEVVK